MKINRLYFSPTNSTQKVIELISDAWNGEVRDIDISDPHKEYAECTFAADELCLVGVPAFGGRVPTCALEHLARMKASATPTVLVATFGNRAYDDTLLELKTPFRARAFTSLPQLPRQRNTPSCINSAQADPMQPIKKSCKPGRSALKMPLNRAHL
ncbi:MAG: hypothetical protein RSD80_02935 [Raoultibacter sp.]